MSAEADEGRVGFLERLGYEFIDTDLLDTALRHRSWCAENDGGPSNERLELLGDAVLGLAVTAHIFAQHPELAEGDLARMRASLVNTTVLAEVAADFDRYVARAERAGVRRVWLDPGIGFGKTTEHNLVLLRDLKKLATVGARLVVGVSRKRFIGQIHALSDGLPARERVGTDDRREGSAFSAVWSWRAGAHIVRVHDVRVSVIATQQMNLASAGAPQLDGD